MKKLIAILLLFTSAIFSYGCKNKSCYPVFEKEYCIGSEFIESDLTNFNFIKLKGGGEFKFHEIWIPRGNGSLPTISVFKDSDDELIFQKVNSYAESLYTVDVYTTREGKRPKGLHLIYVSEGDKLRGLGFVAPDMEQANNLLEAWLHNTAPN
ncbi:hypothetical protein [Kangiella sp. M94]